MYSRPAGAEGLRAAIADMQGVDSDSVQVVTGASEALLILMWLAAEPGANVILPQPGFTHIFCSARIAWYRVPLLRSSEGERVSHRSRGDQEVADQNTKLILVNNPHNPTGATLSDAELDSLHEFTSSHGIQLVSDEVYHPIYHGQVTQISGASAPRHCHP